MATYQDSRYNIALPSGSGGAIVPIKTLTASSSATLSFVDGSSDVVLDNTYRTYIFKFINIHPATDGAIFSFQADTGTNTNYNQTMTTTFFTSIHQEDGGGGSLDYQSGDDQAQATGFQRLMDIGNANDESGCGELWLFSPSSSTYVKHFISRVQMYENADRSMDKYIAGYFNTTTALTRVQFKMSSGNIDAGTIKLYGIA